MNSEPVKFEISDGVVCHEIYIDSFKTNRVSVNFIMPIKKETIAAQIVMPDIMTMCTKKFPTLEKLVKRLSMLYGMTISGSTKNIGDNLAVRFSATVIDDDYSLDKTESLNDAAVDMLLDVIFNPFIKDGKFAENYFENVRRIAIESIDSRLDNKRQYATSRIKEIICEGEPFGIKDSFIRSELENLKNEDAVRISKEVLDSAKVEIITVGRPLSAGSVEKIRKAFDYKDRNPVSGCPEIIKSASKPVKKEIEKMKVTQGKLVLGYRSQITNGHELEFASKVMTDILGGGTYSYLFENVREKMSLCYYCSAHCILRKGILIIDCGIEPENYEKTRSAIIHEFDRIKNGDFYDEIISSSKLSFINNAKRIFDAPALADNWCFNGIVGGRIYSVEEYIKEIGKVTKQQIIDAAKAFEPDSEYLLTSEDK